jgi:mannitol/fructose-specific phosphotransferase system IIA component (Ntr-type)
MELINIKQAAVNVKLTKWQDAVRAAGRLLVDNGFAEERYIEGMVKLSAELGPYIVITPGVAIPHARPEEGAKKVGFAAVTLNPPINFGNEYNDPVYLVLGFCSPSAEAHVELLTRIARILGEEGFLNKVKAAQTPQQLVNVFNTNQSA